MRQFVAVDNVNEFFCFASGRLQLVDGFRLGGEIERFFLGRLRVLRVVREMPDAIADRGLRIADWRQEVSGSMFQVSCFRFQVSGFRLG